MSKLPKRELEHNHAFYKKSIENTKTLLKAIADRIKYIEGLGDHVEESGEENMDENSARELEIARLNVEQSEYTARLSVAEYHLEVYRERIEDYKPIFDNKVREMEKDYDEVWEKAQGVAARHPNSLLAKLIEMLPKEMAEMPEENQLELKVELYEGIKSQIARIADQEADARKQRHQGKHQQHNKNMRPVK